MTLHAAHLGHALGDTERAGVCYRVAKSVDDETNAGIGYVGAAACAEEALLHIGIHTQAQGDDEQLNPGMNEESSSNKNDWLDNQTHALARSAIQRCHEMGGTLEAVGKVVQGEIVGAKSHLCADLIDVSGGEPSSRITPRTSGRTVLAYSTCAYYGDVSDVRDARRWDGEAEGRGWWTR